MTDIVNKVTQDALRLHREKLLNLAMNLVNEEIGVRSSLYFKRSEEDIHGIYDQLLQTLMDDMELEKEIAGVVYAKVTQLIQSFNEVMEVKNEGFSFNRPDLDQEIETRLTENPDDGYRCTNENKYCPQLFSCDCCSYAVLKTLEARGDKEEGRANCLNCSREYVNTDIFCLNCEGNPEFKKKASWTSPDNDDEEYERSYYGLDEDDCEDCGYHAFGGCEACQKEEENEKEEDNYDEVIGEW